MCLMITQPGYVLFVCLSVYLVARVMILTLILNIYNGLKNELKSNLRRNFIHSSVLNGTYG